MADTPSRIIGLAGVLIGAWVLTYWLYTQRYLDQCDAGRSELPSTLRPVSDPSKPTSRLLRPHSTVISPWRRYVQPGHTRKVQKLVPPETRDYRVQKGDTGFDRIAARAEVYGDRKLGDAIARANPWASPDKLKAGVTVLKIPVDPDNIQGKLVWVDEPMAEDGAGGPAAPPGDLTTGPAAPAQAAQTYKIQKDDTLSDISKRFYGRTSLWKTIAEANKQAIPNPDRLTTGVTIKIPPAPSSN